MSLFFSKELIWDTFDQFLGGTLTYYEGWVGRAGGAPSHQWSSFAHF